MQHTSKTILFFGTEDFSAYTLNALISQGFSIGAIITKPDTRRGRRKELVKPLVKQIGEQHNIPVWQPAKLKDIAHDIAQFDAPAGVLVSYGKIIPQSIIDLFSPGIINVHPSLLPMYRGPSPIEAAILHGDTQTGISIMQLSAAMDAGPIYSQESAPLTGKETAPALYKSLGERGAELLTDILPSILDGTVQATPQQESTASYCQLIAKQDGVIDWKKPAAQLAREIRAYQGWPQSRAIVGIVETIITEASADSPFQGAPGTLLVSSDALKINTGNGSLSVYRLKPLGKKEMPVTAFLAGYKDKLTD